MRTEGTVPEAGQSEVTLPGDALEQPLELNPVGALPAALVGLRALSQPWGAQRGPSIAHLPPCPSLRCMSGNPPPEAATKAPERAQRCRQLAGLQLGITPGSGSTRDGDRDGDALGET